MPRDTMPEFLRPLMAGRSVELDHCAVCGRPAPLNAHHVVYRSAGELHGGDGRPLPKPTITLCGFGNNLRDPEGRCYCHGLTHRRMLHFRWVPVADGVGHWEYLRTDRPTRYQDALAMDGWKRVRER